MISEFIDVTNINKLNILGKLLIWRSKNKVHIKDLEKPEEHGTIGFLPNGTIDIHRKNEKFNEYESLGILDIPKFLSRLSKNPLEYLSPLLLMAKNVRKINFEEKEFSHLKVGIFPNINSILEISNKKKNEFRIPQNAIEFFSNLEKLPWLECKNKEIAGAMVFNNENMVGFIQKTEKGDLIFIPLNKQTSSIKDQIERSWFKLDPPTWKPENS